MLKPNDMVIATCAIVGGGLFGFWQHSLLAGLWYAVTAILIDEIRSR